MGGSPGCSSSSTPDAEAPPDKYPDFASFCNGIGAAECTNEIANRCNLAQTTQQACIAEVATACSAKDSEVTRGVKDTGTYKKGAAEACIKAVSDTYATGQISADAHKAIVASCQEVFRVGAAVGFSCAVDTDCDATLGCYLTDVSKGTCQKITTKAVGDDCGAVGDVCGTGLYCGADKACIKRKPSGSDCSPFTKPCTEDLQCVISDATANTGTCQPKLTQGADCTADADCQTGFCALLGSKRQCFGTLVIGAGSPICDNFDGNK
jgi:hypothetical protein